jgi:hypothetical protein
MSTLFWTLFWPLQSAVYSFSIEGAEAGEPGALKTFGELFTLFTSLSTNCLVYKEVRDGLDVFGNAVLPRFQVDNGVVSLSFKSPGAAAEHRGPFASYPYDIKTYTKLDMEKRLPRGQKLGAVVGSQGRKIGTESLPKPKTIVDMVNRVGFLLAKEVQDYMSQFEAADVWDLTPPTGMNPSVSEGMVGLSKYVWNLCANTRTRNEVLRSKIVAMTTTLEPRKELYSAKLRQRFIACIRTLKRGRDRNEEEARKRLEEIEAKTDQAREAQERKRRRIARLEEVDMVTEKSALEKLTKVDLLDQAAIRGLKACNPLQKEQIVTLCLENSERYVEVVIAAEDFNIIHDEDIPPGFILDDDLTEDEEGG